MFLLLLLVASGCFLLLFVNAEASEASEQSERAKLSGAARAGAEMNFWMSELHAWTCKHFLFIGITCADISYKDRTSRSLLRQVLMYSKGFWWILADSGGF